jgi:hypothetical protein
MFMFYITNKSVPDFSPICTITRDPPDFRPENPAFDIRYPAGYQIALPDIR